MGGPVDGRLMPVEVTADGSPPAVLKLPQTGYYLGASDAAAPAVEHVYVLGDKVDRHPISDSVSRPPAGARSVNRTAMRPATRSAHPPAATGPESAEPTR